MLFGHLVFMRAHVRNHTHSPTNPLKPSLTRLHTSTRIETHTHTHTQPHTHTHTHTASTHGPWYMLERSDPLVPKLKTQSGRHRIADARNRKGSRSPHAHRGHSMASLERITQSGLETKFFRSHGSHAGLFAPFSLLVAAARGINHM